MKSNNFAIKNLREVQLTFHKTTLTHRFSFRSTLQKSALVVFFTCGVGLLSFFGCSSLFNSCANKEALEAAWSYIITIAFSSIFFNVLFSFFYLSRNPLAASWGIWIYATLDGITLSILTFLCEINFPGIGALTLMSTFFTVGTLLGVFHWGGLKFDLVARRRINTVFLLSIIWNICSGLLWIVLGFMGIHMPGGYYLLGILISTAMVVIASLFLLSTLSALQELDGKLGKEHEWVGALSILVTIATIYLRILRLFARLMSQRR